ncbi:hypothetical protein B0H16DRAFT_1487387 [Mycena metata]|uniref:Uncharacterized protein n=1 Tax=Mycena metata TaxID=1033252 RepID=A0AAD7DFI8_9AGAR|nr:hypothetical protein B0H16DRAFT_1487387 [Mycena metata]
MSSMQPPPSSSSSERLRRAHCANSTSSRKHELPAFHTACPSAKTHDRRRRQTLKSTKRCKQHTPPSRDAPTSTQDDVRRTTPNSSSSSSRSTRTTSSRQTSPQTPSSPTKTLSIPAQVHQKKKKKSRREGEEKGEEEINRKLRTTEQLALEATWLMSTIPTWRKHRYFRYPYQEGKERLQSRIAHVHIDPPRRTTPKVAATHRYLLPYVKLKAKQSTTHGPQYDQWVLVNETDADTAPLVLRVCPGTIDVQIDSTRARAPSAQGIRSSLRAHLAHRSPVATGLRHLESAPLALAPTKRIHKHARPQPHNLNDPGTPQRGPPPPRRLVLDPPRCTSSANTHPARYDAHVRTPVHAHHAHQHPSTPSPLHNRPLPPLPPHFESQREENRMNENAHQIPIQNLVSIIAVLRARARRTSSSEGAMRCGGFGRTSCGRAGRNMWRSKRKRGRRKRREADDKRIRIRGGEGEEEGEKGKKREVSGEGNASTRTREARIISVTPTRRRTHGSNGAPRARHSTQLSRRKDVVLCARAYDTQRRRSGAQSGRAAGARKGKGGRVKGKEGRTQRGAEVRRRPAKDAGRDYSVRKGRENADGEGREGNTREVWMEDGWMGKKNNGKARM